MVELDLTAARKVFEVNCLTAPARVPKTQAAGMRDHGGAIVHVSSVSSVRPAAIIGFYGASKAMPSSVTGPLALERGPDIRVNGVAPAVAKSRSPLRSTRAVTGM